MKYIEIQKNHPEIFNNKNALFEIITDSTQIEKWQEIRKKVLQDTGQPENWSEIGIVYEDPYIVILRDLVRFPNGDLRSYFRLLNTADLLGGKSCAILPILKNKILLLNQYRHATRQWHWEIPRGFGEPNTNPTDNAIKEIHEEIGGEISELINIGSYHSNTGIEGGTVILFLARLKRIGRTNLDEGIKSADLFDKEIVEKMIGDSEITDGFTIATYAKAKFKGLI